MACAVGVSLIAAGCGGGSPSSTIETRGPLVTTGADIRYGPVGRPFPAIGSDLSDGLYGAIRFRTTRPVTIDAVDVDLQGSGLEYLGAKVVSVVPPQPRIMTAFGDLRGWPPSQAVLGEMPRASVRWYERAVPARGAVLRPSPHLDPLAGGMRRYVSANLVLHLRVVGRERTVRRSVTISYTVSGQQYEGTLSKQLVYCPKPLPRCGV